ncbi:MAG TPA: alkane 1-monooxygenase [Myxococcota bacterium]|nr:alkane 1-monooxygenase [Myxococcota bacterium]
MTAASPTLPPASGEAPTSPLAVVAIWGKHLLAFVLPASSLAFLLSAPHRWYFALPWLLVILVSLAIDKLASGELRQPAKDLPDWPFDAVLYVLVVLQLATVGLLVRMVALQGLFSMDSLVGLLLVGVNSGYSGIVVAHELIHRREARFQWLGRLLLCSVLYEHFYTEHLRGHHNRVGTAEDPATARFGETFRQFWRRTVPGQFRSAWRLETKRLGDELMKPWDPRLLRSRVVHGLVVEWGVALAILFLVGPGAFAIYLLQALIAVRLLEAVNYFEHWGLVRTGRRVTPIDSWDTDSWFTLYTLVGLSRHSDHHANASRPYAQLRHFSESPKLPSGYFGMVDMVLFRNAEFRERMTEELRRRKLGPFAEGASA